MDITMKCSNFLEWTLDQEKSGEGRGVQHSLFAAVRLADRLFLTGKEDPSAGTWNGRVVSRLGWETSWQIVENIPENQPQHTVLSSSYLRCGVQQRNPPQARHSGEKNKLQFSRTLLFLRPFTVQSYENENK